MEKNVNRPQRLAPDQVDGAVDEALERVEQANELAKEDLDEASGGIIRQPTMGFLPAE